MSVVDAFDFFATNIAQVAPAQILEIQAPPAMAERVELLTAKKKEGIINEEETVELERYLALDLIINLAKAKAIKFLAAA